MTVLSAVQSAAIRLIGKKPSTVFSAQDTFSLEMQDLATECARDIAKSHDWQALTKVYTITGNGTDTTFPLPPDYDRMLIDASIYDGANWAWGYCRIVRPDEWLEWEIHNWQLVTPGAWTLLGQEFKFVPAPYDGAQAKFLYISKSIVTPQTGNMKSAFTKDDDTFVLDERLLTLALVWKWRELKRLEAASDQANFEKAFAEISGRDKGARIIAVGSNYRRYDVRPAYPWPLGS